MAKMQVAFYTGRIRFYNRAYSWWLYGPHSHVELVLDEEDGLLRCGASSLLDDGVRIKWMKLNPAHWTLVEVDEDYVQANRWFMEHKGEDYDFWGLLGAMCRRLTGEQPKWTSAGAIAAAFGYPDPWRFDPMTLWSTLSKIPYKAKR